MSRLRVGDLLAHNAASRPDELAVIEPGGASLTWAELDDAAHRLAAGLSGLGLKRGDRVATVVRNGAGAVEALFASAKAGFLGVPVNYGLTVSEVRAILEDSRPHAILVDRAFVDSLGDVMASAGVPVVVRGGIEGLARDWHDADALKLTGGTYDAGAVSPDDLRTIRYTSGTTAAPKGCLSTHSQILASIANFYRELDVPAAPFLQLLPLFSGAGIWMAFAAAYHGVANVIPESFRPADALEAIGRYRVGHACGVPTMLGRMCEAFEAGDYDVSSLKLFGYTGSPMPPAVIRRALGLLPWSFYQGFGGGEMGGLVSYLKPEDHPRTLDDEAGLARLSTVGRPALYAEVVIRSLQDGSPAIRGEAGEITVRSPSNFSGYLNRPDETATTLRGEWVHSGDVGYFDAEGLLHVVDRVKDMVLSGGMNISSAEVEGVLMDHPAVKAAAVFGVPNDDWGELVTAAVIAKPGESVSETDLIAFARLKLAGYKAPKAVKFVDDFPMNAAGKILKRELRQRFATATA
ncbi:class I adenylate-forming enzyme family protein [Caulobacter sp. S45]|uniref:class I adenylate-forming enzyme family protein n=1 Tax=Caulobacter sp. S45 TaxID=1641861 RepID=UPI00131C39AC|nr:AMP-binding protein [Caulobacter sp. S45]